MENENCDGNNNQPNNDAQEQTEQSQQLTSEILTSEQQDALKQAFDDIDIDQSGTINKCELRAALQLIGQNPTAAEIEQYMADSSESGEFTIQELFAFIEQHVPLKTPEQINEELLDAFEKFDEDKDCFLLVSGFRIVVFTTHSESGEFTKQEFFAFIEQHVPLKTPEQINEELLDAFEKFDEDKDCFISRDEFRSLMTKKGDEPLTEREADDLLDRLDSAGEDGKDGKLSIVELGKLFIGDV